MSSHNLSTIKHVVGSSLFNSSRHETHEIFENDHNDSHEHHKEMEVFHFDFEHVQFPLTITIWIIVASLAKVGFHMMPRISKMVPESCLLTILGIIIGAVIFFSSNGQVYTKLVTGLEMSPDPTQTYF